MIFEQPNPEIEIELTQKIRRKPQNKETRRRKSVIPDINYFTYYYRF